MTRGWFGAAACSAWIALGGALAAAQGPADVQRHRFEAAAGGVWLGGASLGAGDAELRGNRVPADEFRLFSADTRAMAAPGFDARVGFWLTRTMAVEGGLVIARPVLRTSITSDVEGAPPLEVEERLDQYFFDGSVVLLLDALRFGATVPFVSGGAGYLRQLHEGRTLVESGQVYHAGGGLRHWLRTRRTGRLRGFGVRVDGRLYVLASGVRLEDGPRTHGALSGALFVTF